MDLSQKLVNKIEKKEKKSFIPSIGKKELTTQVHHLTEGLLSQETQTKQAT
jgi:hypothetical protein